MKKIIPQENWPQSWQASYPYDNLEIYDNLDCRGYAYAYAERSRQTFDMINKVVTPSGQILDVAAAQGNFSLRLAEMGYEVTWNDLREELVDYVKLKHEYGIVHFAPGNVFDLDFRECFDAVLITEIIEHVAHPDEFLRKISKMVKPGGHVIVTTPNGGYFLNRLPKFSDCENPERFESIQFQPNSDGHIFLLHTDEIAEMARQANLTVQEIRLSVNLLTNGHVKLESALKILPRSLIEKLERVTKRLPLPIRKKLHASMAILLQRPY